MTMPDDTISIHDKFQFEIKRLYPLDLSRKKIKHDIAIYFFFPKTLNINEDTYHKSDFYRDLQGYIRFQTPRIPLDRLTTDSSSPLPQLEALLPTLDALSKKTARALLDHHLRMFGCILHSALRDHVEAVGLALSAKSRQQSMRRYLAAVKSISPVFRRIIEVIQKKIPAADLKTTDAAALYTSLLLELHHLHLVLELDRSTKKKIYSGQKADRQHLLRLARWEAAFRKSQGYSIQKSEEKDQSFFLEHFSFLQRFFESALFLNARAKPRKKILEHLFFGLAAGIAMIVTGFIVIFLQPKLGQYTTSLFLSAVIAYIFKDRIKDLLRYFFASKILRLVNDHTTAIFINRRHKIGVCREWVDFINPADIPADVRTLREDNRLWPADEGDETAIMYTRKLNFFPKTLAKHYRGYPVTGLHDIMQYEINHFMERMEDPHRRILTVSDKGLTSVKAKRMYPLDMMIRIKNEDRFSVAHYRLVLTRNGLHRIEHVVSGKPEQR